MTYLHSAVESPVQTCIPNVRMTTGSPEATSLGGQPSGWPMWHDSLSSRGQTWGIVHQHSRSMLNLHCPEWNKPPATTNKIDCRKHHCPQHHPQNGQAKAIKINEHEIFLGARLRRRKKVLTRVGTRTHKHGWSHLKSSPSTTTQMCATHRFQQTTPMREIPRSEGTHTVSQQFKCTKANHKCVCCKPAHIRQAPSPHAWIWHIQTDQQTVFLCVGFKQANQHSVVQWTHKHVIWLNQPLVERPRQRHFATPASNQPDELPTGWTHKLDMDFPARQRKPITSWLTLAQWHATVTWCV